VDVVPYQVTIRGLGSRAEAPRLEPRGRNRPKLLRLLRRHPPRPLTVLALVVGCLAFTASAHAGIDDAMAPADPVVVPPPAAVPAPVVADVPTQVAMTTAATEEPQTLVSPQYQDENTATPASAEVDATPAQTDEVPVAPALAESSGSPEAQATEAAASRLAIKHLVSSSIERKVLENRPRPARTPSAASAARVPPLRTSWYRSNNSQYQFASSFQKAASDLSKSVTHTPINRSTGFAQIHLVKERLNRSAGSPQITQRYHAGEPQYRPRRSEREAVSNVLVRLGEAAQRLALARTLGTGDQEAVSNVVVRLEEAAQQLALARTVGAPVPDPNPAKARATRPADTTPVVASPAFLPRAGAVLTRTTRTLSRLAQPPELPALAPAARLATGLGASLLPTLEQIPRPHGVGAHNLAGGGLANTRRLLQIGLALGIVYLVFLTFWFWGTRGRRRGLRGGVRF
jgi:hypothetical protein